MSVEVCVTGPVIDVALSDGSDAPPLLLQGIVDTGASVICLDRRVAVRLGLNAVNKRAMEVADGTMVEATVYMAQMEVAPLGFKDWVEVFALPMARPSNRVLLGRSFLRGYHVTYNGPDDTFHYHKVVAAPPLVWED